MLRFVLLLPMLFSFTYTQLPEDWFAYLYNSTSNELVRVYLDGTQQTFNLSSDHPSPPQIWNMAVSPDGKLLAYCETASNDITVASTAHLIIRDIEKERNVTDVSLGKANGCRVSPSSFNNTGSMIAVNLVYGVALETEWEIRLLNVLDGTVQQIINSTAVNELGRPVWTDIRLFTVDEILFDFNAWSVVDRPVQPGYLWSLRDNQYLPQDTIWNDVLISTGERLLVTQSDEFIPPDQSSGPMRPFQVIVEQEGQKTILIQTIDTLPQNAIFINGGREIAIRNYQVETAGNQWDILNRAGQLFSIPANTNSSVKPAPDGFILFQESIEPGRAIAELRYFRSQDIFATDPDELGTILWELDPAEDRWSLLWSMPVPSAEDLAPF